MIEYTEYDTWVENFRMWDSLKWIDEKRGRIKQETY